MDWIPTNRTYPELLAIGLGAVVVVTVVVAASISGVAFGAFTPSWEGTSELRGEAESADAETIVLTNTERYEELPEEGSVVFVLAPNEPYEIADRDRLTAFVEGGGTLVVADAYGPHTNPLLEDLGASARIDGDPLRDERSYYRSPALVVAPEVAAHPYLIGVEELTLNHGSALDEGDATVLVRSSEFAYLDRTRTGELTEGDEMGPYPVVTAEPVGDGEVVTVSDPSVFINAMLEREGNRAFVHGLLSTHDRVVFDTSHTGEIPPLTAAVLTLRESMSMQAILGGSIILGIGAVYRWSTLKRAGVRLRRLKPTIGKRTPDVPTEREMRSMLDDRYPEWDAERRDRVVTAVMSRRKRDDSNE
ncbi:DUF4350 domain-containing protein [Natronorarus salvus]|uniref:DUF4350 domain-containing protein n=1 Tax=Natronorarus salvus TaxID=3117733 RepID=UPI002F2643BB